MAWGLKKSSMSMGRFFKELPEHVGQKVIMAAAIIWAFAAVMGVYTSIKTQNMIELRKELQEVEALTPLVPSLKNVEVSRDALEDFMKRAKKSYRNINFRMDNSTIIIAANSTRHFAEFRESIGYIQNGARQNGGNAWHVSVEKLCIGRECDEEHKLIAALNITKVLLEKPT